MIPELTSFFYRIYSNLNRVINQLYVGSIVFFFETSFEGVNDFVVLIDVAETQGVVKYDKYMPKVALRRPGLHKYVVCRFDDIVCNVGLVRFNQTDNRYKVISHHIFKERLDSKMGNPSNL